MVMEGKWVACRQGWGSALLGGRLYNPSSWWDSAVERGWLMRLSSSSMRSYLLDSGTFLLSLSQVFNSQQSWRRCSKPVSSPRSLVTTPAPSIYCRQSSSGTDKGTLLNFCAQTSPSTLIRRQGSHHELGLWTPPPTSVEFYS